MREELACPQDTFAPKRVQCAIRAAHKHFVGDKFIPGFGRGEYVEMEKQERQAVRREAVNTSKEGGALSAPSAPESCESFDYEDGTSCLLEKGHKGWHKDRHGSWSRELYGD